jgi:hypothetical protein
MSSSVPGFPISAAEAAKNAQAFTRAMNAQRKVLPLAKQIEDLSIATQVHIYNVGPWDHIRELGSAGTWFIPACKEGMKFARVLPIPGVFSELCVMDEKNMERKLEPGGGRYIAEQIIGIGSHRAPADSLIPMGVFIGGEEGPKAKPTDVELKTAVATLHDFYNFLVLEAKLAFEEGKEKAAMTITDRHRVAAQKLKLDNEPWMTRQIVTGRQVCPACGTPSGENVVLCPNCKFVLNEEKYNALKGRFA